jgi:hypothetical protein
MAVRQSLEENYRYYRAKHLTPGCRLTHLIGIPTLLLTPITLLLNPRLGVKMLIAGLCLQVGGHWIFERNRPVLFETKQPLTLVSAMIFTAEQWRDVFNGKWLRRNNLLELWEPSQDPYDELASTGGMLKTTIGD